MQQSTGYTKHSLAKLQLCGLSFSARMDAHGNVRMVAGLSELHIEDTREDLRIAPEYRHLVWLPKVQNDDDLEKRSFYTEAELNTIENSQKLRVNATIHGLRFIAATNALLTLGEYFKDSTMNTNINKEVSSTGLSVEQTNVSEKDSIINKKAQLDDSTLIETPETNTMELVVEVKVTEPRISLVDDPSKASPVLLTLWWHHLEALYERGQFIDNISAQLSDLRGFYAFNLTEVPRVNDKDFLQPFSTLFNMSTDREDSRLQISLISRNLLESRLSLSDIGILQSAAQFVLAIPQIPLVSQNWKKASSNITIENLDNTGEGGVVSLHDNLTDDSGVSLGLPQDLMLDGSVGTSPQSNTNKSISKKDQSQVFAVENISFNFPGIHTTVVNDTNNLDQPVMRFHLDQLEGMLCGRNGVRNMTTVLSMYSEYYNSNVVAWEPLLEKWCFRLALNMGESKEDTDDGTPLIQENQPNTETRVSPLSLVIDATEPLNVNVTVPLLNVLTEVGEMLSKQTHSKKSLMGEAVGRTDLAGASYIIRNFTGYNVTCSLMADCITDNDRSTGAANPLQITSGATVPCPFHPLHSTALKDSSQTVELETYARYRSLSVDINSCAIPHVPLDRVGSYVFDLPASFGTFEDQIVSLVCHVSYAEGRKILTLCSSLMLHNSLDQPLQVELSLNSQESSNTSTILVKPSSTFPLPLPVAHSGRFRLRLFQRESQFGRYIDARHLVSSQTRTRSRSRRRSSSDPNNFVSNVECSIYECEKGINSTWQQKTSLCLQNLSSDPTSPMRIIGNTRIDMLGDPHLNYVIVSPPVVIENLLPSPLDISLAVVSKESDKYVSKTLFVESGVGMGKDYKMLSSGEDLQRCVRNGLEGDKPLFLSLLLKLPFTDWCRPEEGFILFGKNEGRARVLDMCKSTIRLKNRINSCILPVVVDLTFGSPSLHLCTTRARFNGVAPVVARIYVSHWIVNLSGLPLLFAENPRLENCVAGQALLDCNVRNASGDEIASILANALELPGVPETGICDTSAKPSLAIQKVNSSQGDETKEDHSDLTVPPLVMFGFSSLEGSSKKLHVLHHTSVPQFEWSQGFGVDTIGAAGLLSLNPIRRDGVKYELGVTIDSAPDIFFRTHLVVIRPRFIFANLLSIPIQVKQDGTIDDDVLLVPPNHHSQLKWINSNLPEKVCIILIA